MKNLRDLINVTAQKYGENVAFRIKKDEKYLHFYKDKKNMNEMRQKNE